ncbi:tetratricopeptide repeat protein [Streptomyces sp. NPDC051976]|uniref:tetratricopeptide repeat protein n=1 Tax=Streptomyces sp. NPDC051976 TaxID=3154947 RepID=UPI003445C47F
MAAAGLPKERRAAEARAIASTRSWRREDATQPLAITAAATNAQGRHNEAISTYDELLPTFTTVFGAEHPQTLVLRSNRAQTLIALSRYTECEAERAAGAHTAARHKEEALQRIAAVASNRLIYALNASTASLAPASWQPWASGSRSATRCPP